MNATMTMPMTSERYPIDVADYPKGYLKTELFVVRRSDILAIVEPEMMRVRQSLGYSTDTSSSADNDGKTSILIEHLNRKSRDMGLASYDSYRKMVLRGGPWMNLDKADRMLVGIGMQHCFNNGQVTIFKLENGFVRACIW
jgi:hypothetical protein